MWSLTFCVGLIIDRSVELSTCVMGYLAGMKVADGEVVQRCFISW